MHLLQVLFSLLLCCLLDRDGFHSSTLVGAPKLILYLCQAHMQAQASTHAYAKLTHAQRPLQIMTKSRLQG